MCEGCYLIVAEGDDAVSGRSLTMFMSFGRVLALSLRLLVSRRVILLSVLLANTMGMRGATA